MTIRQNNKKPALQVGQTVRRIGTLGVAGGVVVWTSKGDQNRSEQLIRLDTQGYSDGTIHANQYVEA